MALKAIMWWHLQIHSNLVCYFNITSFSTVANFSMTGCFSSLLYCTNVGYCASFCLTLTISKHHVLPVGVIK